ncbi:glycosyltransferase family 4 protein [Paucidesulfovibrio longus]|uniref:glycosyltransferase family 4 protein n=1 Tax=Paucidesulfovibrio longus TaxID=889 RepID=UPI0003B3A367|nr:glycosyltransferase family 4 protein [Paucidesulfovibrio longus]
MRIAFLGLRGIAEGVSGGIERHARELSVRMAALGHEVTVFCRSYWETHPEERYRGVRLKKLPAIRSKHLEAISHTALCQPFVLAGYDVVHFHATGPSLLSWVPRLAGRKVAVTVHGLDWRRAKWGGLASLILRAGAWTSAHCPNATIVVSRELREHYRQVYDRPTTYIPNGVNPPEQRELDRLRRFGLEPGAYLLSLGRLVPEKGLHTLVEAFRGLDTNLRLVIAGDPALAGDYPARLRALAGDDPRIVFPGPLFGEDKDEAFSNARLFCLPSELEGMPIALLEAMSYGCPALVSDIPECLEVVRPDGEEPLALDFPCGNAPALNLALDRALHALAPHDLKRLGERARQHVLAEYDWDRITRETLHVYETMLRSR